MGFSEGSPVVGDSALAGVFNAQAGQGDRAYSYFTMISNHTYAPACSFLHLIPGAFEEGGICSDLLGSAENSTLCEAISANEQAKNRLSSGRSVLSIFQEPGSCAQLQGDICWGHEEGR